MKISICTRNYDPRCISKLESEGHEVLIHENCVTKNEEQMYDCIKDSEVIIAGVEYYPRTLLQRLDKLKIISRNGIGFDNVDVEYCKEHNIIFTRTLGVVEPAVAEQVLAYIMYYARRVDQQSTILKAGIWRRNNQFGLNGRIVGLIGFGGIGREIAKRALPFGARVVATSHHDKIGSIVDGVEIMSEDDVLAISNFVSINVPLRKDTYHYCDEDFFKRMKEGSYFINIARGQIMDLQALTKYLDNKHLKGCAVDVFDYEPCLDSPLSKYGDNVIITPHTCPFTINDRYLMDKTSMQNTLDAIKKASLT